MTKFIKVTIKILINEKKDDNIYNRGGNKMDKKSTVLLTVIAVATLLVAVVGSTFAFFAIQETNTGKVDVTTTTAKGSDIFKATGSGTLSLNITNEKMLESVTKPDVEGGEGKVVLADQDTDSSLNVSLEAGSGKASCEYDLVWTESTAEGYIKYAKTTAAAAGVNEFTISGSSTGLAPIEEINVDKASTLGHFKIEDTYEETSVATTQTWTFNLKFYNLPVSQATQMGKTYSGQIAVKNVVCTNTAVSAN